MEQAEQLTEKLKTMDSRLSFLLNKVQMDEETRVVQTEDRKKLEAQVISYTEKCKELQKKLLEMGESNRVITQAMRLKQEEVAELAAKYDALKAEFDAHDDKEFGRDAGDRTGARPGGPDDIDNVRLNEGRGRFYVEAKSIPGGAMLLLKGRKPIYSEWMLRHATNEFLKRAQKSQRFKDIMVEKLGQVYGLLMVEEEEKKNIVEDLATRDRTIEHIQNKLVYAQDGLAVEEDAKRRMLLRYYYIHTTATATSHIPLFLFFRTTRSNVSSHAFPHPPIHPRYPLFPPILYSHTNSHPLNPSSATSMQSKSTQCHWQSKDRAGCFSSLRATSPTRKCTLWRRCYGTTPPSRSLTYEVP